jgi:hypothetical protein
MVALFKDERIITTTDGNIIILTTHRVRYNSSGGWGKRNTTSIMLEKISSIQATYITYPTLLMIGGLFLLGSFMMSSHGSAQDVQILVGVAIAFCIAYFVTRKQVCIIASDGGARIAFGTTNMSKDMLLEFMDKVESAKADKV